MSEKKQVPNSAKELRLLFNVCSTTWTKELKLLGIRARARVYKPIELQLIISKLGNPLDNP